MVMTTPMVPIGHGDGYGAPLPVSDLWRRPEPSPYRYAVAIRRTEPIPNTGRGMKGNCSRQWGRMLVVSNLRLYQEVLNRGAYRSQCLFFLSNLYCVIKLLCLWDLRMAVLELVK
ncbi:hypothetical protein ACQJBY_049049 [Aegilops geniculata]